MRQNRSESIEKPGDPKGGGEKDEGDPGGISLGEGGGKKVTLRPARIEPSRVPGGNGDAPPGEGGLAL